MINTLDGYLALVTSEHFQRPDYIAVLTAILQPFVDEQAVLETISARYDLDVAIGAQEDTTGQWVGVTRFLQVPLANVYFSFDTDGLGFDQGTWFGPFNPTTGLVRLSDADYRTLLFARVASNSWDGTIEGAYNAWNTLFEGTGHQILIQDNQDMSMVVALWGSTPTAVVNALFTGGHLTLKPATVRVAAYLTPTIPEAPFFGFDMDNEFVAGFDEGAWGAMTVP